MIQAEENEKVYDYSVRYQKYGYSPKTLGWDKGKQDLRFSILTSQYDIRGKKILDIGCGFGDLNGFLDRRGYGYEYCGIDMVEDLLNEGKKVYPGKRFILGDFLDYEFDEIFDYAVASGIFNIKFNDSSKLNNYDFIDKSITKALSLVKDGIAFDFLSDKVDYQYEHTFHSSPSKILDFAYQHSRNVMLRNDYMPFEFSLFIFKDDSFDKSDTTFRKYKKDKAIYNGLDY